MPEIVVLIGCIASGKSTYARKLARKGWVVINDDDIVKLVHGRDYTGYDKELKPLYKTIENTILTTAIAMGRNVVIDRGVDVRKNSRRRWVALAASLDIPIKCVVFPRSLPERHAKRRFESDSRGLSYEEWLAIAIAHDREWESPSTEEGFVLIEHYKIEREQYYV
jgi:predicted kinase